MAKIIVILLVAAIIESVGVAVLSGGLKQVRGASEITVPEIARVLKDGCTNGKVILGVALEAVFFGCLLYLLSRNDVSFIWPLTSLGFIVTTLAAKFILNENVSMIRWAGVMLIALGALLTSYSETVKTKQNPPSESPALAAPRADAR
jgi:drug/metabolite transporter (DMT)-like permease